MYIYTYIYTVCMHTHLYISIYIYIFGCVSESLRPFRRRRFAYICHFADGGSRPQTIFRRHRGITVAAVAAFLRSHTP